MKNENGYFPDLHPVPVHCLGEIPSFQPVEEKEAPSELTRALHDSEVHQTLFCLQLPQPHG